MMSSDAPSAPGLLARLGFGSGPADTRFAWRIVCAAMLLYAVGFALFSPRIATNVDEAMFLRQARMIWEGERTVVREDALTGEREEHWPSRYWVGAPLLMAPLVGLFGEGAAWWVPCLGLLAGVLFTARGLQAEGRSPVFALLVLGYFPALVMGRVAMSDAPSLGLVALGLWLFFRGIDGAPRWWLGSGFVAGVSLAFRVTNVLVFAPFFAGTVLRRERKAWALVVGGLVGLAARVALMYFYFGDALAERGAYYFEPHTLHQRLPLYLLGLLVLVPGGLALGLAYRGRRRPELLFTIAFVFCFFLFQQFSTRYTGLPKRVVLALRYFMPLVPVLVYGMAESMPRLWRRALAGRGPALRGRLETVGTWLLGLWIAGVCVAAFGVHVAFDAWARDQADIRDAIHASVPIDAPIVTNWPATRKFLRPLEERYAPIDRVNFDPADAPKLLERHGRFFVVFLDRTDSPWWREDAAANQAFVDALPTPPELLVDRPFTSTDRLRIWQVEND